MEVFFVNYNRKNCLVKLHEIELFKDGGNFN